MPAESTPAGPPGPPEPTKRKEKTVPDKQTFEKMMKVKETDPEQKKKRKRYKSEEEKLISPEKLSAIKKKKPPPEKKELFISTSTLKKVDEKDRKKLLKSIEKELEKDITKEKPPLKFKKMPTKKPSKKEKKAPLPKEKIKKGKIEKKLPEKIEKKEIIAAPTVLSIPPNLMAIATAKTSMVSPLMPTHELLPLFEHAVGTIFVMQEKGISRTHIILNNPKFEATRFLGMEIIIEKYSSAPDSFNITFTGPNQEAIEVVKGNIEGLYKTFKSADLPFSIGTISAEYRPLIRRKPQARDKDFGGTG